MAVVLTGGTGQRGHGCGVWSERVVSSTVGVVSGERETFLRTVRTFLMIRAVDRSGVPDDSNWCEVTGGRRYSRFPKNYINQVDELEQLN